MIAAQSNDREIVFKLRLMADPRNAAEAQKFSRSAKAFTPSLPSGPRMPGVPSMASPSFDDVRNDLKRLGETVKRAKEQQLEREQQSLAGMAMIAREKEIRAQQAAIKERERQEQAYTAFWSRELDKREREAKRAADAEDREQERLHGRHRQRQLERARRNRAGRELDIAQARQAGAKAAEIERGRDARRSRFASARGGFSNEAFGRVGEGLMSVTTGAAALGLVGQRDSDKIMDTALTVGGGIQAAKGVMNFASGVQGLSSGGSLGGIVASAAASTGPLLAAAAALASVGVSAKMVGEISSGTAGEVDSFTSRIGRFEEMLHRGMTRLAGGNVEDGVYTQAYNAQQKTERMQKERDARLAMQGRKEAMGGILANVESQKFQDRMGTLGTRIDSRNAGQGLSGAKLAKANNVDEQLALHDEESAARARAVYAKTDAERQEAAGRLVAIQSRLVELSRDAQRIAKDEADEKIRGARESVNATKSEIELRKKSIEELQNRLLSAEERFGNLSEEEQNRVLAAGRVAREGQSLIERSGGNQRSVLYQRGQAMLAGINKEDRRLLSSVGLEGPEKAAREAAVQEARRRGFNDVFGGEERSKVAMEEKVKQKLELTLKDQREYVVKVERDAEEEARHLANLVNAEIAKKDAYRDQKFLEYVNKGFAEVNQKVNAAFRTRQPVG